MAVATTFTVPNYSGMLYTKTNLDTPFLDAINAPKYSAAVEFPLNQEYSLGTAAQPAISETASLTAPAPTSVARTQATNVCQIYHESVGVSYKHQSNMGLMTGLNVAGQQPNPMDELDWQIAKRMEKIARDVEYTFLNGAYNKATSDATIDKTRGIITAVTTNAVNVATSNTLTKADLRNFFKTLFSNGARVNNGILFLDATEKVRLTALYEDSNGYITPASRNIGGIAIDELVTDFGRVGVAVDVLMPAGKILFANTSICYPVEMIVPNKGNFFYEALAKDGASEKGQIFGQIGLDYGAEWMHGVLSTITA
jgi:hypothetical protein